MTSLKWVCTALALTAACAVAAGEADAAGKIEGDVRIGGSVTVYPITRAVAEEFRSVQPRIRVDVGHSGTVDGFQKFGIGETDINDASRPIEPEEVTLAEQNEISFIELPVAYDGLSVVVNAKNGFVDHLTVDELHRIWMPDSRVTTWKDVRPEWPAEKIALYGPGVDSGTFEFFTRTINGKPQACRSDFIGSEDENVLLKGVSGDPNALGVLDFAYTRKDGSRLKIVPIDDGKGPVTPSVETIGAGSYAPLSRPIFLYVSRSAADRPEVGEFVKFYLENASALVGGVGYGALPDVVYALAKERFARRVTGSAFEAGSRGVSLEELMTLEAAGT